MLRLYSQPVIVDKDEYNGMAVSDHLLYAPPISTTGVSQKIYVGVGCSWALYDGVGVWPVAGAEEKWLGTEYGKRCYNSSGTAHHPTAGVPDMKENTDLRREPRENAPRYRWEKYSSSKPPNPLNCNCNSIENACSITLHPAFLNKSYILRNISMVIKAKEICKRGLLFNVPIKFHKLCNSIKTRENILIA
ncbi:hypothetical protein E2986_09061 [Frieseomelitta varia]|uniref:Uncharacterized protein n=2 Tax=Frieseomelitta varia TaxID=561572 RepID=A0A833S2I3_9HYME|nr:hypothetical protein E2986_09061 [Frieseomelitta varia]